MHTEERPIGYTSSPSKLRDTTQNKDKILLLTDNGLAIGLQDALCNTLATGTTGCGKTGSVGLPCANSLISYGLPGFMTATKTNFGQKIRSLAKAHGRAGDIVEFGTSPSATKCNLLANMEYEKMRQFFEDMVKAHTNGVTENWVWLLKGIHQAAQCGLLLRFLSEKFPAYQPAITLVSELLHNQPMAIELYKFFLDHVYDKKRPEHELFRSQVDSQRFHILRKSASKASSSEAATEDEQNTWNLQGIRMALEQFMATPGMARNFSDPAAPGLNMKSLLLNNKLVLGQFITASGPAGDILARHMLSAWYEAILDLGTVEPGKVRCFTLLDEFQLIADLSENRFSDFRFSSLSREYGVINVFLTQSESALHVNCPNPYRVQGFTSNFNQRFFFYSNDSQTLSSAAGFDPDVHLQDLAPTTMFVTHFDQQRRAHVFGVDSLNNAFAETDSLIAANPVEAPEMATEVAESPALPGLMELARRESQRIAEEKKATECMTKQQAHEKTAHKGPTIHMNVTVTESKDGRIKVGAMKNGNSSPDPQQNTENGPAAAREQEEAPENRFSLQLRKRFPDIVIKTGDWIIPVGWHDYIEKSFELFELAGLKTRITGLSIRRGTLKAWNTQSEDRSAREGLDLLNNLLEHASRLCMICGAPLPREWGLTEKNENLDAFDKFGQENRPENLPICRACLIKTGMDKYFEKEQGETGNFADERKIS